MASQIALRRTAGACAGAVVVAIAAVHAVSHPQTVAAGRTNGRQTIDRSVGAAPGQRLSVALDTGAALIVHGTPDSRVRLRAQLSGPDADTTQVTLERAGEGTSVRASSEKRGPAVDLTVELWVPSRTDLNISSAGGAISLDQLDGTV